MKRRSFLKTSAASCAITITAPVATLAKSTEFSDPTNVPAFELEELTIPELQQGLQSGKFSARSLVEKYLDRINDVDKKGPAVNSVIELNPEAESSAVALDRERKE
jgi:amidase